MHVCVCVLGFRFVVGVMNEILCCSCRPNLFFALRSSFGTLARHGSQCLDTSHALNFYSLRIEATVTNLSIPMPEENTDLEDALPMKNLLSIFNMPLLDEKYHFRSICVLTILLGR